MLYKVQLEMQMKFEFYESFVCWPQSFICRHNLSSRHPLGSLPLIISSQSVF